LSLWFTVGILGEKNITFTHEFWLIFHDHHSSICTYAIDLRRITYEATPASIIEKIALKEAVHPLQPLFDLRHRLGPNRRCLAFFHPSLPSEPLVFVHVALLPSIAHTMDTIRIPRPEDSENPYKAAIF